MLQDGPRRPHIEKGESGERYVTEHPKRKAIEIALKKIVPNLAQPRLDFPEDELRQLAESIRLHGVLQPVLVRRDRDHYILIAGERRWRAAQMAGLRSIPAMVQCASARDSAMLALIENMQRSDLNFFEEAAALYALLQDRTLSQEALAESLGMSQPALANKIRLLRLSAEEQRLILENRLTERHARALLRLEDPARRAQVLRIILDRQLNVAQSENLIRQIVEEAPKKKKPVRMFIAKDLRLFLNTIDHAVTAMQGAGIHAVAEKRETDEYFECVVRIPKINSSTR